VTKPNDRYEPSAAARTFARDQYDMFQALIKEGFNEHQALIIIGQFMSNMFMLPGIDDEEDDK
jgi:hypothetical protein